MDFGLKAGKFEASECVKLKWNKAESGACYVKYEVVIRNASGSDLRSVTVYNIGEMIICGFATNSNVTHAQLTVSFKAVSRIVAANVSDESIHTQASTSEGTTPLSKIY